MIFVTLYLIIGVTIVGPSTKYEDDQKALIQAIEAQEEDVLSTTRYVFEYVTYTVETESKYCIYDENGEKVLERLKENLQLEEVQAILAENYPDLMEQEIEITYGYDGCVYMIQDDDYTMLMLDFDTLETVFYMKEG